MSFGSEDDWGDTFGEKNEAGELVNMPLVEDNKEWPSNLAKFLTKALEDISLENDQGGTFTFFEPAMITATLADPSILGIIAGVAAYIGLSTVVVPKGTELGGKPIASPGVGALEVTSLATALLELGTPSVDDEGETTLSGGLADAEPKGEAKDSEFPRLMQKCFSKLKYACTGVDASGNAAAGVLGVE